jgi:hypothetical protein
VIPVEAQAICQVKVGVTDLERSVRWYRESLSPGQPPTLDETPRLRLDR